MDAFQFQYPFNKRRYERLMIGKNGEFTFLAGSDERFCFPAPEHFFGINDRKFESHFNSLQLLAYSL